MCLCHSDRICEFQFVKYTFEFTMRPNTNAPFINIFMVMFLPYIANDQRPCVRIPRTYRSAAFALEDEADLKEYSLHF